MREEKVWSIKEKLENYKISWIKRLKMQMTKLEKFRSIMKSLIEINNKLNSLEIKFKNKEEKVKQMKGPSKSCNTFWLKNWESFKTMSKETLLYKVKLSIWEMKLKRKEIKVWLMKLLLENFKTFLNKKLDNMKMNEAEWDNKRMIKSDNYRTLSKMKEERVWWTRKRSDNYKPYLKLKSEKPMISIQNLMIFQEKVNVMTSKLDSSENKLKRKEEKVLLIKTQ